MKNKFIASAALSLLLLSLTACTENSDSAGCVEVVADFGILSETIVEDCVSVPAEGMLAKDVLLSAGLTTEGTLTYGDQIVCRVNDLPSATEAFEVAGQEPHVETCADMPPAFAYWAVWVKESPEGEWEYAQEGVGTLVLLPGQSVGLAFSAGGETPTPN